MNGRWSGWPAVVGSLVFLALSAWAFWVLPRQWPDEPVRVEFELGR